MTHAGWAIAGALLAPLAAQALDPSAVFEKAAPSVWIVRTYDAAERPVGQGSAVVVAPGELVTNCHVLVKSKIVYVRRDNVMYEAKLEQADVARDLCLLKVAHFDAPAAQIRPTAELKVGERVFAIGNPQGMEVTLSDGLISGLRTELPGKVVDQGGSEVIQTTAPISPGSSGGGLFDGEGRLIGITSLIRRDAQNLNIALPADWIGQIRERASAALAKQKAPAAGAAMAAASSAPGGLPAAGTSWVYSFTDRVFGKRHGDITVRVLRTDASEIEELATSQDVDVRTGRRVLVPGDWRFYELHLDADAILVEMSPYLVASSGGNAPAEIADPSGYPAGAPGLAAWKSRVRVGDWEDINVPAGTFRALRVEAEGQRTTRNTSPLMASSNYKMTIWYAPDVKRIVKLEHRVWWENAFQHRLVGDDVVELISYRPPS